MKINTNPTATPDRIMYIFIVVDEGEAGTGIMDSIVILAVVVEEVVEVMDASATVVAALAVILGAERR